MSRFVSVESRSASKKSTKSRKAKKMAHFLKECALIRTLNRSQRSLGGSRRTSQRTNQRLLRIRFLRDLLTGTVIRANLPPHQTARWNETCFFRICGKVLLSKTHGTLVRRFTAHQQNGIKVGEEKHRRSIQNGNAKNTKGSNIFCLVEFETIWHHARISAIIPVTFSWSQPGEKPFACIRCAKSNTLENDRQEYWLNSENNLTRHKTRLTWSEAT